MAKIRVFSAALFFIAVAAMVLGVGAQESPAPDYVMYETQYLQVHSGKWADVAEKLAAHNRKFHSSGPYTARVWRVVNGPHSGQLVWAMGPCTFTDLDERPSGDPHDPDWLNNVVSSADAGLNEYWRLDQELSYAPDNEIRKIIRVRFFDIKGGENYRFEQMMRNLKAVREKKNHPSRVSIYRNRFWTADGREWAEVTVYDKWADLDRPGQMSRDYDEVHGDGSWRLFLEEVEEVIESAHEEYRELMPELSGPAGSSEN